MSITVQFLLEDPSTVVLSKQPMRIEWHFKTREEALEATGVLLANGVPAVHTKVSGSTWTVQAQLSEEA